MRHLILFLFMATHLWLGSLEAKEEKLAIHNGSRVSFDYTLTVDGAVADSSEQRGPLEYTQGDGKLIPGLARQLEGMRAGEEKTIIVPAQEAYGDFDPEALKEVPLSSLPPDIKPEVGASLQAKNPQGNVYKVRIAEIKKNSAVIDFNHPLAGKTLTFKVKIVSVK